MIEQLMKTFEGQNALYAMQSSPTQVKLKVKKGNSLKIKSSGKKKVNGETYAKKMKVSIGVDDSDRTWSKRDQIGIGTLIASKHVMEESKYGANEERAKGRF